MKQPQQQQQQQQSREEWASLLSSYLFPRVPVTRIRLLCMQTVIYILWMAINLVWQSVPGAFIVNTIIGLYLFFLFPHIYAGQMREEEEEEQQRERQIRMWEEERDDDDGDEREEEEEEGRGGGPDSETILEVACRHLERMRNALEAVDEALGVLHVGHEERFGRIEDLLATLHQEQRDEREKREREQQQTPPFFCPFSALGTLPHGTPIPLLPGAFPPYAPITITTTTNTQTDPPARITRHLTPTTTDDNPERNNRSTHDGEDHTKEA